MMATFHFTETRTGKVRTIMGADDAVQALQALTIYPWAFEPVLMPVEAVDAVRAYSAAEKAKADERAAEWMAANYPKEG